MFVCRPSHSTFLDASTHLYMRVYPSVRPLVRPSVRPSFIKFNTITIFDLFCSVFRQIIDFSYLKSLSSGSPSCKILSSISSNWDELKLNPKRGRTILEFKIAPTTSSNSVITHLIFIKKKERKIKLFKK